jgi:hypothetical protein
MMGEMMILASTANLKNAMRVTFNAYARPSGSGTCTIYAVFRLDIPENYSNPSIMTVVKRCVLYDTNGKVVHLHNYSGTESIIDEDFEKITF